MNKLEIFKIVAIIWFLAVTTASVKIQYDMLNDIAYEISRVH
jgi:hypothetical protein